VRTSDKRFAERQPPEGAAAFVSRSLGTSPYHYKARILFHAPASAVREKTSPRAGQVEEIHEERCILHTGSNSLDQLALYVALKGFEFEVLEPAELVAHVAALGARCQRAAHAGEGRDANSSELWD